jgi:hypothetical protein
MVVGLSLALAPIAHADVEPPQPAAPEAPAPDSSPPLVAAPPTPESRLHAALERFEFGDYAGVVAQLAALIDDGGGRALARPDRLEALRAYGIACVLVGRPTAAEGAFLLWLEADPAARLDPRLVRPEAVGVFEAVRQRERDTLIAAYKKGRGRRYAVLNLLPPAGQLQNRQYKKGYALLGVELALLGLNLTSGSLLYSWRGAADDFPGHASAARVLRPVDWVSFGALIGVVVYGIVDGFVVGHRRAREERQAEDRLRASSHPDGGARLSLGAGTFAVTF